MSFRPGVGGREDIARGGDFLLRGLICARRATTFWPTKKDNKAARVIGDLLAQIFFPCCTIVSPFSSSSRAPVHTSYSIIIGISRRIRPATTSIWPMCTFEASVVNGLGVRRSSSEGALYWPPRDRDCQTSGLMPLSAARVLTGFPARWIFNSATARWRWTGERRSVSFGTSYSHHDLRVAE